MSGNKGSTLQIPYNLDVVLCQLFMIASNSQYLNFHKTVSLDNNEKIFDWYRYNQFIFVFCVPLGIYSESVAKTNSNER